MVNAKITKNIFLDTKTIHSLVLDAQPDTDFIEFYVSGVYITKVNVNKLSKGAKNILAIETTNI
jgi:hypothetical protein